LTGAAQPVTNTTERVRELFKDRPEPSPPPPRERKNFRKRKRESDEVVDPGTPEPAAESNETPSEDRAGGKED
jgi:hypothetical protein